MTIVEIVLMKPHESPRINKKSVRGDSRDSWPVWNRGIRNHPPLPPAMNTMNFRFSHATYGKAPTLQRSQCGAFAPHWRQGKVVHGNSVLTSNV